MGDVAVITGASMGLGEEFARQLARRGVDVVLVARSEDKLRALARRLSRRHGVEAHVLACDLSVPGAAAQVVAFLEERGLRATWLVNNAGFGAVGPLVEQDPERVASMVRLNVGALVELTRLLLPSLLAAPGGRLINVASTAAFQPIPLFAVYAATKAFVLSFTEAIAEEQPGLRVTALCPGPTHTQFHVAAKIDERMFRFGQTAREVVTRGLRANDRGRVLCITQKAWTVFALRLLPRKVVRWGAHQVTKWAFARRG